MTYTKYALGMVLGASVAAFSAAPALATTNTNSDHKVGICHATGSKTNPYVYIVVDKHAADAHAKHQDGKDIIGASSAGQCPKPAAKDCPKPTVTPKPTPKPVVTPKPTATPKPADNGQTLGTAITPGKGNVEAQPSTLPVTGAEQLSVLLGLPAMAGATAAYLRSRKR
jgi:hypothetical protein